MNRNIKIDDLEIDNLIRKAVTNSLSRRQQSQDFDSPIQDLSNSDNEALVDFAEIRGGISLSLIRTVGMRR
jgi:hypothetical protein